MNLSRLNLTSLIVFCLLLLPSCTSLQVEKLQEFRPTSNSFVFLSNTRWDPKLRIALQKNGFTVKRFNSQSTVISEGQDQEIARVFNESEARYGIELLWNQAPGSNSCINGNGGYLINATLQVSDIQTNEVLLVIENSGVTHLPCGIWITNETIFEKLANALKQYWI